MRQKMRNSQGSLFIPFTIFAAVIAIAIFSASIFFTNQPDPQIRNKNLKIPVPTIPTRALLSPDPSPIIQQASASSELIQPEIQEPINPDEEAGPSATINP